MSEKKQMTQNDEKRGPKAGTVWHRKAYYTFIRHGAETRHVFDRTLGGDVIFVSGRWSRFAPKSQCTLAEWNEWTSNGFGAALKSSRGDL